MVRGDADGDDLASYRKTVSPEVEKGIEVMLGIKTAAEGTQTASEATAASNKHISVGIDAIRSDPTARRTLIAALLTLLATLLIPAAQTYADLRRQQLEAQRSATEHADQTRHFDELERQIRVQRNDETERERLLIRLIQPKK